MTDKTSEAPTPPAADIKPEHFVSPWIEQTLYVECPHCDKCHLIESDHSMSLPEEDEVVTCDKCSKRFVIMGKKW